MKILACDRCGKSEAKDRTVQTFFIITDRGTDAAGSTDDFGENVDLCDKCLLSLISQILGERDYERNRTILKWIRKS